MNPGGLDHGLDPTLLGQATQELAFSFMAGSKATLRRMAEDDRYSPPIIVAAVVKAHLLGAASMVAANKPAVDSLLLVTWLIEAVGEAMAEAASAEPSA